MQEKTKDCESEVENMAKFGINDILNAKTKAAGQQAQTEGYKEIYLSPYEVKAAQENTHQKLENIEELADSFLHVGQEQPTVLARVNGEYRIIDGHRRNAANILNLERGHKEYEKSPLNTGEKSYDVGNIYQYYAYSLAALVAGGNWLSGANCGARAVACGASPWHVYAHVGARGACDSL